MSYSKFKLYAGEGCSPCKGLKALLDAHGYDVTVHTFDDSTKVLFEEAGVSSVPTLISPTGERWLGFMPGDQEKLVDWMEEQARGWPAAPGWLKPTT